jgi:hypothetical protein
MRHLLDWKPVMTFDRLFRSLKDKARKPVFRDANDLNDRELSDIGLPRPGRRSFEHAPVEVPNDRI